VKKVLKKKFENIAIEIKNIQKKYSVIFALVKYNSSPTLPKKGRISKKVK